MMDEPFGALDAITRNQIRYDLERLWMETKKTVLFITHSIEEAIGLSDRVLVMSSGPGRIIEEIRIELPRPRPVHLGQYPEFSSYADRIYAIFESSGSTISRRITRRPQAPRLADEDRVQPDAPCGCVRGNDLRRHQIA